MCRDSVRECARWTEHPMYTIGEQHEPVPRKEKCVNCFFAAQAFLFAKGVHDCCQACVFASAWAFVCASLAASRSALRAAACALRSSCSCLYFALLAKTDLLFFAPPITELEPFPPWERSFLRDEGREMTVSSRPLPLI